VVVGVAVGVVVGVVVGIAIGSPAFFVESAARFVESVGVTLSVFAGTTSPGLTVFCGAAVLGAGVGGDFVTGICAAARPGASRTAAASAIDFIRLPPQSDVRSHLNPRGGSTCNRACGRASPQASGHGRKVTRPHAIARDPSHDPAKFTNMTQLSRNA
jgi:hypothetical protein